MEDTVLCKEPTGVLNSLDTDRVSNVTSLSAFLATLNQSSNSSSRIKRFLDETGSLDVNVGDNSSCRLSDISSVSYTNITQDDNESLGCETNASLENVIDSASSCRSDEESPYELDQDDVDYDLDSNGYFGSSKYLVKHPSKVDKSSMTNLALSEDDIKNFMGSVAEAQIDSNSSLYDEMKVGKSRLVLQNSLLIDEYDHINNSEKLNNEPDFQVQNDDDLSSLDLSLKSPGFRQHGIIDSNIELKEIFHEKECSNMNKMELKLNGIVGPKAAICNSKGSKVTLEFYCGKGSGNDRSENSVRVRDVVKVHRNDYEDNMPSDQNKIDSCEKSEAPIDLSQPVKSTVGSTLKNQDDVKKVRISSKLRPSPGLAKRIGDSENWSAEDTANKRGIISDTPESALNGKSPGFIEENCANKTVVVSGETCEPKPAERKKGGGIKALDFCNEDIESSLNEIRSILYGSRIGLANGQVNAQEMNINPNYEVINYSKLKTTSCNDICASDSILKVSNDQNKIIRSCSLYEPLKDQKFVSLSEKSPQNSGSFEFNNDNEDIKLKTDLRRIEKETKLEMSVIDELLEELRMNDPSYNDESTNHRTSSPDVEIKSEFKVIKTSEETGRSSAPYNDTLTVPYALEKKTFSLSPEATDCDSIDASSIISEEEKTSPSAMPVVEDGLSSDEELADKDLREEAGRGDKRNKEIIYNHLRSDNQSARVPNKHDDKLLPLPASGSSFGPANSTSHPKQNGVSIRTKNLDKVARRDLKPKIKASPTDSTAVLNDALKMVDHVDSKCNAKPDENDITKSEVEVSGVGQDLIEKRKMSEIALFQSSMKSSSAILKLNSDTGTARACEDSEKPKSEQGTARTENVEKLLCKVPNVPSVKEDENAIKENDACVKSKASQDAKLSQEENGAPTKSTDASSARSSSDEKPKGKNYENERESFLIEGVLFRAQYLGSTQLVSEGQPSKATRLMQAQEAINRIKDPTLKGNPRPSTLVDLFVSVEKIMVLNTDLQEIMMDHALRTISYIADIGDVLVVMARRGPINSSNSPSIAGESTNQEQGAVSSTANAQNQAKICCHVFESDEAQLIAQSISQAFQVAYIEFLKANGINDPDLIKEMDYQDVLSQQEIFGEELFLFSNRDMQKEVLVPKSKGEPLGMVIVESGWGSMVPTVVLANMAPGGAAARCGQLNIGDQIISVNGISLVGLPLSTCQAHLKALRNEILARFMVVSCTPVVEVLVKRPDIKYQLGFSVQNGVICSLLRGGIAERGGVRVGHRIIEINGQSVVAVPHDKIVSMLASSVGEIHMKTMQTSIYRLLTGQDTPHYI